MFRAFFAKKAASSVRFGASAIAGVRGPGRERRLVARRLLHEPLEPRLTLAAGPLLISEFLALNNIGLKDDNGDRSDWIEIHNPTGAAVNLDGYYLTDDDNALTKWRCPNMDIAAGGYLLVYASGKDRANPTAPLHTNFKLDGDGEYLALVRPDGTTIAHEYAPEFPAQAGDISYGLASSSASGPEAFFGIQTPGETNGVGSPTLSGMLAFSRPGGTFVEPFELTLTTDTPGVVIRYTLDRTVPTVTSSLYTAPITISATTMVRASIFVEGKPPSVPVGQTYFALDPALASFDSNLPLVVIDTFGQTVWNVNTNVPFVSSASLVIEPGVDGRAALTDAAAFCGPTGVKCRGWTATVTKRNFEKWNYALETWNEQGDDLAVSLLGLPKESDWVLLGPYTDKTLMRDYLAYKWSADMGEYAPRTQYFELYRNMDGGAIGQEDYCGVYVLVEKIKPGQNRVDIEKLEPTDNTVPDITGGYIFAKDRTEYESTFSTAHSGTWVNVYPGKDEITVAQQNYLTAYVNEVETVLWGANFADPVNGYAKYIDVDSFIDSLISVELAKNVDGYGLSSYFYKDRNGKLVAGPVWDYNLTMANAWYGGTWNPAGWKYTGSSDTQCPFYHRLLQDPNFVQAVIDRWTELRRDILSEDRLMQDIDDTAGYLDEAQQRNYERYDDVLGTCVWPEFYIGQTYEDEVDILRMWLHDRLAWMDAQFLAAPQLSQDGGTIDVGDPVTASTPIGTVYYTTDGSDPRLPGGGLSPTAVALGREPFDSVLVPFGANWQYVDNGAYPLADAGTPNWNQLNHDPLNPLGNYGYAWFTVQVPWKYGQAQFGYGDGDETTIVDYGPDPDHKYVTTYFRQGFGLADKSAITSLRLRLLCDDGAVVYLNGSEIARFNMPTGTISNSTKASSEIPDGDESRYRVFVLNPSKLVDGDNVIAVEIHQSSLAGPDISFDLELTATASGSSGGVAFDENTLLSARTHDGAHWSGLTQAAFVVESPLAITEIMYNPPAPTAAELAAGFTDKEQFEFIEIRNTGVETVSLAEVRLVDGVTFDFAAGSAATLAPGEFVVVVRDQEAFELRYGAGIHVASEFTGGLTNNGERIALEYGAGVTIEAVEYGASGDWPGRADGHGSSLERIDAAADIADPANWRSSTEYGGSPGEAGLGPITDVLVNEVLSHTDPPQVDAIELVNTTDAPVDLGGWYLSDSFENFLKYQIPAGTILPAGGYLVFDEYDFNWSAGVDPNDFGLDSAHGDDVWLMATDAAGNLTRFVDHVAVPATANGESFGRWPDADGGLYPMRSLTLGEPNSGPRVGPVIISELQYNPGTDLAVADLEFIEIYNPTAAEVNLTDWLLREGVDFDFAPGTRLGPFSTLVVVPFDPADAVARAAFESHYPTAASAVLVGPYLGRLSNGGEKVQLQRPDGPPAEEPDFIPRLLEDEAAYDDEAPWPTSADGVGNSLVRVSTDAWGHDAASWIAQTPSPGSVAFEPVGGTITLVVRPGSAAPSGDSQGESDALPEGLAWVDEWTRFWVEIWGKTASDGAAMAGFSVDLEYNTTAFSAVSVEFGPAFTDGQTQDIEDAVGRVDAIAASTGEESIGEDKYVLLARVRFEPTDEDAGIPHNGAGGYVAPVDALQLALADGRMELRELGWTSAEASAPPIDVWPVMYDYDNDDLIGLGDLSYFASAYGKAADDPASPYGEASDFDHSGHIDLGDLSYFAANYRRTRSIGNVVYPHDFPESWLPAEAEAAAPEAMSMAASGSAGRSAASTAAASATRRWQSDPREAAFAETFEYSPSRQQRLAAAWLYEVAQPSGRQRLTASADRLAVCRAVDLLLAAFGPR